MTATAAEVNGADALRDADACTSRPGAVAKSSRRLHRQRLHLPHRGDDAGGTTLPRHGGDDAGAGRPRGLQLQGGEDPLSSVLRLLPSWRRRRGQTLRALGPCPMVEPLGLRKLCQQCNLRLQLGRSRTPLRQQKDGLTMVEVSAQVLHPSLGSPWT